MGLCEWQSQPAIPKPLYILGIELGRTFDLRVLDKFIRFITRALESEVEIAFLTHTNV